SRPRDTARRRWLLAATPRRLLAAPPAGRAGPLRGSARGLCPRGSCGDLGCALLWTGSSSQRRPDNVALEACDICGQGVGLARILPASSEQLQRLRRLLEDGQPALDGERIEKSADPPEGGNRGRFDHHPSVAERDGLGLDAEGDQVGMLLEARVQNGGDRA